MCIVIVVFGIRFFVLFIFGLCSVEESFLVDYSRSMIFVTPLFEKGNVSTNERGSIQLSFRKVNLWYCYLSLDCVRSNDSIYHKNNVDYFLIRSFSFFEKELTLEALTSSIRAFVRSAPTKIATSTMRGKKEGREGWFGGSLFKGKWDIDILLTFVLFVMGGEWNNVRLYECEWFVFVYLLFLLSGHLPRLHLSNCNSKYLCRPNVRFWDWISSEKNPRDMLFPNERWINRRHRTKSPLLLHWLSWFHSLNNLSNLLDSNQFGRSMLHSSQYVPFERSWICILTNFVSYFLQ